jgi:hypothetical protein
LVILVKAISGRYDERSLYVSPGNGAHHKFNVNGSELASQTSAFAGVSTSFSLGKSNILFKMRMGAGPVITGYDVSFGLQPFDFVFNLPVSEQLAAEINLGFVIKDLNFGGNNIGDVLQLGGALAYRF